MTLYRTITIGEDGAMLYAERANLVILSNRGPFQYEIEADGSLTSRPSGGGLVGIINSALRGRQAVWITTALTSGDDAKASSQRLTDPPTDCQQLMISLDQHVKDQYYNEIANRTLWFLQHRLAHLSHEEGFDLKFRDAWAGFSKVNGKFADMCAKIVSKNGVAITADYHLSLAPEMLRVRRPDVRIAHFTACPWVDPEYLAILPDTIRRELLSGMLGADLLEFTARRWSVNFLACCAAVGYQVDLARQTVLVANRTVRVRELPVGVDAEELRQRIASGEVAEHCSALAKEYANKFLIVRVERLDPAKNALRGLSGFELLLESQPGLRGKVAFLLHLYASRSEMPEYRKYALQVVTRVQSINARYGTDSWQPCVLDDNDSPARGLATLIMADVVVVNSVADAMNMVAKEAPVVGRRDTVLILSRTAGAADDLGNGAILVNPFDTAELAEAMSAALSMNARERCARAAELRRGATRMSPASWLERLLSDLE